MSKVNSDVDSGGTMLDGGSLAAHSSLHVPWQAPIIKDLIVDVSVGQTHKGLSYLHLTLWLLTNVCYTDRGSLPQSVRQWWGQLVSMSKVYQQCWKEWAG